MLLNLSLPAALDGTRAKNNSGGASVADARN